MSPYLPPFLVMNQIAQFRRCCHPNVPEWYETRRKTTMVVFWL